MIRTVLLLAAPALIGAAGPTLPCLQEKCGAFVVTCKIVSGCNKVIQCMEACKDSDCENSCFDDTSSAGRIAGADIAVVSSCGAFNGCFHYGMVAKIPEGAEGQESSLTLATFDGSKGTTFDFIEDEDPVMGSQCWGNWTNNTAAKYGSLNGVVTIVDRPAVSLVGASPGFVKTGAAGSFLDASSMAGGSFVLEMRSLTPYNTFHFSFASGAHAPRYSCTGGGHIPFSRGCYKAKFALPQGTNFSKVRLPLSDFSDKWKPATGDSFKTCAQDSSTCVTAKQLASIQLLQVWAEGATGAVHLDIRSISIEGPSRKVVDHILV